MSEKGDPEIRTCSSSDNWTCITFRPDLAKFGMEKLEDDTVELMRKRVYDLAGILGRTTKVYLDGKRLPINKFEDYGEPAPSMAPSAHLLVVAVDLYLTRQPLPPPPHRSGPVPRQEERRRGPRV